MYKCRIYIIYTYITFVEYKLLSTHLQDEFYTYIRALFDFSLVPDVNTLLIAIYTYYRSVRWKFLGYRGAMSFGMYTHCFILWDFFFFTICMYFYTPLLYVNLYEPRHCVSPVPVHGKK